MQKLSQMTVEEKRDYFANKYDEQVRHIGKKSSVLKWVKSLMNNTAPNPDKLFVIEGIWAHEQVLEAGREIRAFIFCPDLLYTNEADQIVEDYINRAESAYIVSEKVFESICEAKPDGLMAICALPYYTLDDIELKENNLLVILDGLEIPGNVGTIIRSVDGVGADGIIMTNRKVRVNHPKLIRSSQGSNTTVPMMESETEEAITWLKKNSFKICLTDTDADKEYYQIDYRGRTAIVMGSERYGISQEWYDADCKKLSIPMEGNCDSLNVAIATSIVLYEASLQQKGKIKRLDI